MSVSGRQETGPSSDPRKIVRIRPNKTHSYDFLELNKSNRDIRILLKLYSINNVRKVRFKRDSVCLVTDLDPRITS